MALGTLILTPEQMRKMEQFYFAESGVPSIEVMEQAASALASLLVERFGDFRTIFFACGPGGNGGDGLAAARLLKPRGADVAFVLAEEPKSPDAIENLRRAREAGVRELSVNSRERPDVWVDALFGTGLSRAPAGNAAALIRRMNQDRLRHGSKIVAVDIPSGLSGLSGRGFPSAHDNTEHPGICVYADVTLALRYAKTGHYLNDGLDVCGEVRTANIDIRPTQAWREFLDATGRNYLFDAPQDFMPQYPRNTHKGERGHVLVVAGSVGMAGAAALCAGAALRSGAGLVTVACPASIVPILQVLEPCAMCVPLPEKDGALAAEAADILWELRDGKQIVAGPGLSRRCAPEVMEALLAPKDGRPASLVLDADALNILAEHRELLAMASLSCVLTPHPGEARRLLGRELTDPVSDARALAALGDELGCKVVLKGASRVVCEGAPVNGRAQPVFISATGGSGMAKGGSGDVFAGLLAGLRCCEWGNIAAACEVHGLAGALAEEKYGDTAMTSRDLLEMLPEAFRRLAARREEQP